ncbi:hypothetical protein AMTR_s00045p00190410 [Amborella trichopoda]|uniref:Myb/SANT-like domain-containing protein n=1 Tax=Amborella trichopoda TaxID=13333 RepID=W1P3G8_AMBTC|nr:hypothetical protein AMTR_s00045p00190410 [Amborella trichopoda]
MDNKEKNLMWTDEMDNCLVDQLLKQVHLGCRVENGFRRKVYTEICDELLKQVHLGCRVENGLYSEICDEFEKVTRIVLTSEYVKNRMKNWKRRYDQVNVMMTNSGFGWMLKYTRSQLRRNYGDYPRVKMYRTKMIPFFSSLPIVLGDDKTDGRYGVVGTDLEDGISRQDTTSLASKIKQPEKKGSRVGEAIVTSIFEITVAFDNAMEQMTKRRQRVVNNKELMT